MEDILRKIAKSHKYQLLYSRAKDIGNIRLFRNVFDFSMVQMKFLQWLQIYESLYSDLYMKEEHISIDVIDDDIRVDAYLLWKSKKKDKKEDKPKNKRGIDTTGNIPSVIFKRRR